MRFIPQSDNETAGLVLFQNNENHLRAEITMEAQRLVFVVTTHIKGTDKKDSSGRYYGVQHYRKKSTVEYMYDL